MPRLLLISNSTNHGQGYLDHVLAEMDAFLGPVRNLVFVPFALKDREGYGAKAAERLAAKATAPRPRSAWPRSESGRGP